MCCYKIEMQYSEMYQCPRENYKNSDFCVFHYGYEADLINYNKDKINGKKADFILTSYR